MKKSMLLIIISGVLGLALVSWGLYLLLHRGSTEYADYPRADIIIGDQTLHVVIAATAARRSQGLSYRESMPQDEGMLFTFPVAMRYSFWMKDMHFPLDIIWIQDGRIADISANVPAPAAGESLASLPTVMPSVAVASVLEVNAGLAGRYGWKAGDAVQVTPRGK